MAISDRDGTDAVRKGAAEVLVALDSDGGGEGTSEGVERKPEAVPRPGPTSEILNNANRLSERVEGPVKARSGSPSSGQVADGVLGGAEATGGAETAPSQEEEPLGVNGKEHGIESGSLSGRKRLPALVDEEGPSKKPR